MSDKTRDLVYQIGIIFFLVALGVAVAFGVLADTQADALAGTIVALITSITGVGVSGLAKKNIRQTTTQTVVTVQDVIDAIQADQDETAGGRHRADSQAAPTVLDQVHGVIRSRADQVRARYGQA